MNARAALEKGRQVQLLYLYSWFKTNLVSKACEQKKQTLWPLFMDGVQLPKAKTTSRRQFTFYHSVPTNSWYSFYRLRKDERLSQPCSHPVVLNTGLLNWESST